ncbi:hypothetical protein [Paenibacillus sp. RC67]|uniref:hypothetical protein n=1 Tax=Paenibacillus sp. RC67 TaxID=3039392 RepID=UPI0024AD8920|nr:hypothetical protein [Paenibacillus sp. RC67]
MRATQDILQIWNLFDSHPMETLTKAWYAAISGEGKQRSVETMEEHRHRYGLSGNCFDLALWLIHAYRANGMNAYGVGHNLHTPKAHVAVVAVNYRGQRYFCDLGDQWIEPILVDSTSADYCEEALEGFVTGGKVKPETIAEGIRFAYIRPNGKVSYQSFNLTPIQENELVAAGHYSQSLLRHPLVEIRLKKANEIVHWEFDRWSSFISCNDGLVHESKLGDNEQWAERIHEQTGMNREIVMKALALYAAGP